MSGSHFDSNLVAIKHPPLQRVGVTEKHDGHCCLVLKRSLQLTNYDIFWLPGTMKELTPYLELVSAEHGGGFSNKFISEVLENFLASSVDRGEEERGRDASIPSPMGLLDVKKQGLLSGFNYPVLQLWHGVGHLY